MDDERAIERVLVNYCTGIDKLDEALLASCFTADAPLDYGAAGSWTGGAEIAAYMMTAHRPLRASQHRLSNVVVEVDGDRATARSYVDAVLIAGDGSHYRNPIAEYDDGLQLIGGEWKICRRRTTIHMIGKVELG